ncbi:alpha-mannosidase [Pseudonocardia asaccharolytica]|uniref:Putative glycosyl hydrolase n=1 Tax=Pseudonocardia asaccharolytica DSM 44247 = NBRC 16224 TaxID=1123024 RepID=A0A511CVS8_9PSEU|nr:glycoside hydrolase family 38 C-terminal domain-containing protein [Pseudonocardia asaccharolytica]GEL16680.1 putative glycosyl hydrolase [Pseudonocardia asaccharolytica DSM 44247 = NBRC 16224]
MHDDRVLTEDRIARAVRDRIEPAIHWPTRPLRVGAWEVPDEPVGVAAALGADFHPARLGDRWGRPWGTTWFRFDATVPPDWVGRRVEALVDLGFDLPIPGFQAEGLAFTAAGVPLKGVQPRSIHVPVDAPPGGPVRFLVEAAANPDVAGDWSFRPTGMGEKATAPPGPLYLLRRAELAVWNETVWELAQDVAVADGLMRQLDVRDPRRHDLLRALERMLDRLDPDDVAGTAPDARAQLAAALGRPAHRSAHRIVAVGHAHIDSAWLWPVRETIRKVARTVSNALRLMEHDPRFVFACSQAQHYQWLKDHYPGIDAELRKRVAAGQVVPVGGMWVEPDANLPGGESMVRQLVTGKRFFLAEFGVDPAVGWLPDSFGYSAALPQLLRLAGARWFVTQKLSWNQRNRMPHHTFWWEGLDGSRIFTHFPPVDTYNAELSGAELAHAARTYAEHGRGSMSLVPFGHGDGGGGPTREMLAAAARTADLEGSPRVTLASPEEFFAAAQAEYPDAPVWRGEMYLELHRGSYTSQARTKQGNRRCEHLLREAELWCTTAAVAGRIDYPYDDLDRIWKVVLLNQFHDILAGSSIAWVHREAEQAHERCAAELEEIIAGAQSALLGPGDGEVAFNAAPYPRDGISALGARPRPRAGQNPVVARRDGDGYLLDNGALRVRVDARGLVTSILDVGCGREVVARGGAANRLRLHRDLPNRWDAWDVDEHYRRTAVDLMDTEGIAVVGGGVSVSRSFGDSILTQRLALGTGESARTVEFETVVDWHESEKLLKACFDLDVHAERYAAETQFGHVFRPTHRNTSWDAARFETCGHRWVHVGETGYGIALVNDSTYGHDVSRTSGPGPATTTQVGLSLLRAPLFPDPRADHGRHTFRYALVAGADIADAVRAGYAANLALRTVAGRGAVEPIVRVDHPALVVESVKLAEDRSGDVVVRLYEAVGGRAAGRLAVGTPLAAATQTDLLEREVSPTGLVAADRGGVAVALRPFQILTVRLRLDQGPAVPR